MPFLRDGFFLVGGNVAVTVVCGVLVVLLAFFHFRFLFVMEREERHICGRECGRFDARVSSLGGAFFGATLVVPVRRHIAMPSREVPLQEGVSDVLTGRAACVLQRDPWLVSCIKIENRSLREESLYLRPVELGGEVPVSGTSTRSIPSLFTWEQILERRV